MATSLSTQFKIALCQLSVTLNKNRNIIHAYNSIKFAAEQEAACCHGITIVGGSMPEWNKGLLYNTCCVFGRDGKLKAKHRKAHLFDIEIHGDISFKESDTFTAGENPTTTVNSDIGCIRVGICHDIRFLS